MDENASSRDIEDRISLLRTHPTGEDRLQVRAVPLVFAPALEQRADNNLISIGDQGFITSSYEALSTISIGWISKSRISRTE